MADILRTLLIQLKVVAYKINVKHGVDPSIHKLINQPINNKYQLLDTPTHLYKRVCASVGPLVCMSVGPLGRPSRLVNSIITNFPKRRRETSTGTVIYESKFICSPLGMRPYFILPVKEKKSKVLRKVKNYQKTALK